jgi:dCMP deaminase
VTRPSLDDYYLAMLKLVASRGTCRRRQVAAILTDVKGVLISTGYNGVPSGMPHCIDTPCSGANDKPGNNDNCLAIHAEQNCLLRAGDRLRHAHTIYCSTAPCFHCAKLIISAGIKVVVASSTYAEERGLELKKKGGVEVRFKKEKNPKKKK